MNKLNEIYKNSAIPTLIVILLYFTYRFYIDIALNIFDRWILLWLFFKALSIVLDFWQKKLEKRRYHYINEILNLEDKIKKFNK